VAVPVVDRLKLVDFDEQQGHRSALRHLQRHGKPVVQASPVGE
jgi:hypothetical protein